MKLALLLRDKPLVIASHNAGKIREITALLAPFDMHAISSAEKHLPEPEETGQTFHENAAIKSESASRLSGHAALADDSGLVVPVLGGEPGIYSARWAGEGKDFALAMRRVQDELLAKTGSDQSHRAHFICVLSLSIPGEATEYFEGRVDGTLTFPPRGEKGFGYDPVFIPEGHRITFAEMPPAAKHAISHRAKAFEKFTRFLAQHTDKAAS